MKNTISLPNKIYFAKEDGDKAHVVIEPLQRGYGVTIGNALRRVLLSSIPGAAVIAVKIKGVDHEFSGVPNVTEDVVDIILNLKQIRLRLHSEEPVTLTLMAKGQKQITAGLIKPDPRVEIVNPDLVIATLDGKTAEFQMEIVVDKGLGYVPVEMRESEKHEAGMIAIDAIFTPVRNVNFEVQNVRVGQITNFDKLTLTIETDGTISGREAMDKASQILVDHFTLLNTSKIEEVEQKDANLGQDMPETKESDKLDSALDAVLPDEMQENIKDLSLSNRAYNGLLRNNIRNIIQLKGMTREDFAKLDGLGEKSIDEILIAVDKLDK